MKSMSVVALRPLSCLRTIAEFHSLQNITAITAIESQRLQRVCHSDGDEYEVLADQLRSSSLPTSPAFARAAAAALNFAYGCQPA